LGQRQHLIPFLEAIDSATVACAGDIMLDRFVYGNVSRISPEAPIPVIHVQKEQAVLGGLGNAVRNLDSLGCATRLFSITGKDDAGAAVDALLREVGRCEAVVVREESRSTPVKVRYVAHGQQLLRADHESTEPASAEVFEALLREFKAHLNGCSVVLLSDYAKGVLAGSHAQELIQAAREAGKPVVVDPKGNDYSRYRLATVIKPNLKELAEATGMIVSDSTAQEAAARKLLELTEAEFILLTRGPGGMLLVARDTPPVEFASLAREVYDVSGAGDTVAAVLAAALGSGAGMAEAAELANVAAGIVVGKVGTATVSRSEIIQEIERGSAGGASSKILGHAEVIERQREWQRLGGKTGFAYGSFHPLTSEHLELLERTRAECDRLVVGLAAGNPGHSGDLQAGDVQARALLLASLMHVEAVVVCNGEFPRELMEALQPAVMVELEAR
jgi:D-beta-D-heptose 7-phosphate kinase/D-beta-D-heptose 1-phosphate adenosyltransferase